MQGIAALPMDGVPQDTPPGNPGMVGSLTTEEAATLGRLLSKVSQDEIEQLRELASDLREFSSPELRDFLGGVDYIMRNAGNYAQSVRNLIQRGVVEPGDLPPKYIPTFFSILRQMVLDALKEVEGNSVQEKPQGFAKGGLVSMAEKVRKAGRHGDTMLAHITPREAKMLKESGGAGTINPLTGLPEYKSFFSKVGSWLKKAAPVLLPVALSFIPGIGPAIGAAVGLSGAAAAGVGSAIVGAVGAGVGGLIAGQKPMQALGSAVLGGIGGYAFSQLLPAGISGLFTGGATGEAAAAAAQGAAAQGAAAQGAGAVAPTIAAPVASGAAKVLPTFAQAGSFGGAAVPMALPASAAAAAPSVSGGLGSLFSGAVGALKNPWVAAGLAGTAGLMLGGAGGKGGDAQTLAQGPTGVDFLAQNPEKYGFSPEAFAFNENYERSRVVPTPNYGGNIVRGVNPQTGGQTIRFVKDGGHINGPGTGTSDDVPAMLSDGEFVLTAKAVRGAGDGSRIQGAKRLYKLMNQLEKRA